MGFSKIYTASLSGLSVDIITVETDVVRGLYHFSIVGLPDKSVEESRERICTAIKNSGFESPKTKHHKIVSSLVPSHIKKTGPSFDLPIAISYLQSIGIIKKTLHDCLFLGELSLDGNIQPIKGLTRILLSIEQTNIKNIYIPQENGTEAHIFTKRNSTLSIYTPKNLLEVISHIKGISLLKKIEAKEALIVPAENNSKTAVDFSEIRHQEIAKRAAIIAVAGGHNLFLYGPPGSGKTLIAKACARIMPLPTNDELVEIVSIHTIGQSFKKSNITNRPFRSPHHTASYSAVIGGGSDLFPGEISLAHKGILFLDELPEFDRRVLESLRQPLEEGTIHISRAKQKEIFPADFLLIAAANPCPCGYRGSEKIQCTCKPNDINRYKNKVSGPILDRIELVVKMTDKKTVAPEHVAMLTTDQICTKIEEARKLQRERCIAKNIKIITNSKIPFEKIIEYTNIDKEALSILQQASEKMHLSKRAEHNTLRVARTIADLEKSSQTKTPHVLEALSFRQRDY